MNKLYSVHDHWTDIDKKNDVDIESIDGVITGIKVNGEDYGGTSWTEVFSGDVVTSGESAPFSGTINAVLSGADTIKVFYNDGVYILPLQVTDDGMFYGANPSGYPNNIDFSQIPFLIKVGEVDTALYTYTPGPQDLTILEPQSGGGESDLSIATLTFTNGEGSVLGAIADDGDNRSINNSFGDIIKIILYKGQALIEIDGTIESTSGNIEDLGKEGWLVTGDCTVTVSGGGGSPE